MKARYALYMHDYALAMKARYALYMHDYDVAEAAAKQCIGLGLYSLYASYADLFKQQTKNVPEKIFCLPRLASTDVFLDTWFVTNGLPRNAGGYGSYNPSWDLLAAYLCTDGLPIDESPLFDPHNPFENRDPRCTMTIVEFNTRHCGFEYDPSPAAKQVMNYKCFLSMPRLLSSRTRTWTLRPTTSTRCAHVLTVLTRARRANIPPLSPQTRRRCARLCA